MLKYINKLLAPIKRIDPGFSQIMLAIRATLAFGVTILCVMHWAPLLALIYAGLTAVLVSLSTAGSNTKERINSQIIATLGFTIAATLGYLLHGHLPLAVPGLALLTFVAFYMQRFGQRYLLFPPIAVIYYIFAIALPVPIMLAHLPWAILANFIGGIAAILFFILLRQHAESRRNLRHLGELTFNDCHWLLNDIIRDLNHDRFDQHKYHKQIQNLRIELSMLVANIDKTKLQHHTSEWLQQFWLLLYALLKVLTMTTGNLTDLISELKLNKQHKMVIIQNITTIQTELHNIGQHYIRLNHDEFVAFDFSKLEKLAFSALSYTPQQKLLWLNVMFGLTRMQALLKETADLLDQESRWLK